MAGNLYLIPNSLGNAKVEEFIPSGVLDRMKEIRYFIVEDIRTARRFLIKCGYDKPIDEITFFILNKHSEPSEIASYLNPCKSGNDMGVISEAGLPGIADPGAAIVEIAHRTGIRVIPLVGPSSILLALIASGMNGQQFVFHGYLPVKSHEREIRLKELEKQSNKTGYTQIFMETPYRNNKMLDSILKSCRPGTRLGIACDLTLDSELIKTKTIEVWKKKVPDLHKRPCIFLIA